MFWYAVLTETRFFMAAYCSVQCMDIYRNALWWQASNATDKWNWGA